MNRSLSSLVKYGFQREPKIRHFLYSMAGTFLYFCAVGIPLMFGYVMRVARQISNNKNVNESPSYRPIKPLLRDGFVFLFYALITVGVPTMGIFATEYLINTYVQMGSLAVSDVAIINGVVSGLFVATLCGTFILPGMICAVIIEDNWISGLDFSLAGDILYRVEYIKMYILLLLFSIVTGSIVWLLITFIVTIPLGLVFWFVYLMVIGQLLGFQSRDLKGQDLDRT